MTAATKLQDALGISPEPVPVDIKAPLADVGPSDADLRTATLTAEKPSFLDAVKASFRVDNSASALWRWIAPVGHDFDDAFDPLETLNDSSVKERIDALTFADRDELFEELGGAFNQDHFDGLLERFEKAQTDEELIVQAGARGFVARIGANLLDPVDLAVTAAAAPVGVAAKAYKLGKLGRIATVATTAGAANAAVEATVSVDNPFRDEHDVMFAALAGVTLGGALGSLSRGENIRLERTANDAAKGYIDSVGAARRVLDSDSPNAPLSPRAEARFEEIIGDGDAPEFRFGAIDSVLTNLRGRLFGGTEGTRSLSSRMLEGGFLKDKTQTRSFTAEGRADSIFRSMTSRMMNQTDPYFSQWAKARGINAPKRVLGIEAGEEFYTEVAHALRGITDDVSDEAMRAAEKVRPLLDDMYELARQAGVRGFDKEPLENFFPRMFNQTAINRAVNRYGEDGLVKFFTEALIAASDDLPEELATKIARGYTRTLRRTASGLDAQLMHGISLDDMDRLRELLGDTPEVDQIVDAVERFRASRGADGGTVRHAKSRTRLDEGFATTVRTLDGEVENLRLTDLTENDARRVLRRYFQVMAGHVGLAKEAGITSRADFDAAIRAVVSRGESEGIDPRQLTSEVDALEKAYKLITGTSIEENVYSVASQATRAVRDYNFTRVSGKFGVAQLAELGNIVSVAGGRTLFRHLPELQRLTKRAADGQLDNRVARQLEEWFGPGTDFETHPAIRALDEFGEGFNTATRTGRLLTRADVPLQISKRAASVASLMAPINARLEKMAAVAHVLEFSDLARSGGSMSGSRAARWRGAGLDDATQARVVEQITAHASFDGGRLTDLNGPAWDADVADAFGQALRRQTSYTVQRNDFADIPVVMYGPAGRLLGQFKSFMIGSISKQLERGVHYSDLETVVAWSAGMFFAGLGYVGQVYIDHANDPEKRAELLQPDQIIAASFQRAGFAAILVPPVATAADIAGYPDMFSHRTSGLASSLLSLDANPTSSLLRDIEGTVKLPLELLNEDYEVSQADLRRIERTLPFHRVLGVKNFVHMLEDELPEQSR